MPARPSGRSSIYQGRAARLPIRVRLSGRTANPGGAAGRLAAAAPRSWDVLQTHRARPQQYPRLQHPRARHPGPYR